MWIAALPISTAALVLACVFALKRGHYQGFNDLIPKSWPAWIALVSMPMWVCHDIGYREGLADRIHRNGSQPATHP